MESINTVGTLEIGTIIIGLFGGLALFLYGMDKMTDALKIVAGGGMKSLLARLTTNRFNAAIAGAFVTAVIQSSSVTTVLVVGFISAGLMSLTQSMGVIMGANIGTTVTAQIVAFKVTQYALVMVAIGFVMQFVSKQKRIQQYGAMIMGLGLIFFGMELMSSATKPLRAYQPFIDLMQQMDNPLLGVLIGALFTAIIQSSSATTGVVIVLASQGFITLEAGIALAFGANIGTCVTAILAAIGKPREAVQAAVVHVLFNVLGVVIWFGFIGQLAALVRLMSPTVPELTGMARLAAEVPRQVANAHTLFNVTNTFIFIWFTGPIAMLVHRLVPKRPITEPERVKPMYLDEILLETPELALDRVRLELGWLGAHTLRMVRKALPTVIFGTREDLEALAAIDDDVDSLYSEIVNYLGKLAQQNLLQSQSEQAHDYMTVANYIESIGDMIETNLVEAGSERLKQSVQISATTRELLQSLHDEVFWAVERAVLALTSSDRGPAEEVMAAKLKINRLANQAEKHLSQRLIAAEPNRFDAFRIESEIVEYLKRVYYFAKRIAKVVADADRVYKVMAGVDTGYVEMEVEADLEPIPDRDTLE
jgi:phosphate:Na+ symporter